ncbi:MAG: hypothetical protein ACREQ9_20705, partial [Candidatus Binatia bacterium]
MLLLLLSGLPAASREDPAAGLHAGTSLYLHGRFAVAAVSLKRFLGTPGATPGPREAQAAYFLGRTFQELGLRGLALHYLGRAESAAGWRVAALREIARAYLQVGEPQPVLDALA